MQLDKWKADELKAKLHAGLRDRPDTTFEVGEIDLGGAKAIFTYELGYFFGNDAIGEALGLYTNAYVLYFNDAVNEIRVIAKYVDDPLGSKDDLARAVPREQLEKIARAFLDAYTQSWGN